MPPLSLTVTQVYQKDLVLWKPITKRVYDNNLWSSVTQVDGKAKISIPATSNAVNRTNETAAYFRYPFYCKPTSLGKTPPVPQITRAAQDYPESDGSINQRMAAIYGAYLLPITSDGNPSTPPSSIGVGDILLVEDSQNNGAPVAIDITTDPTLPTSEKPTVGIFGQAFLGRKTYANERDMWIVGGNSDINVFSPLEGHEFVTVTKENDNTLSINCEHQDNLNRLWPTCAVLEADILLDQLLYTGGMSAWNTLEKGSKIYSYDGSSVSLTDCPESMTKSVAVNVPTSNVIMFSGGIADSLTESKDSVVFFNPYNKTWTVGSNPLNTARRDHQVVILDGMISDTAPEFKWALFVGGKDGNIKNLGQVGPSVFPVGHPINKCELLLLNVHPLSQGEIPALAPVYTGSMSDARYAFGMVKLPDGRVLVVGGIGNNPSSPIVNEIDYEYRYELNSCEIFDPSTGFWSPIGSMRDSHSYCVCNYVARTNRVYVYGGYTSSKIEYLDLSTMTWHISRYHLSTQCVGGVPINFDFEFSALMAGSSWNSIRTNVPEYSRYDGLNSEWRVEEYLTGDDAWKITSWSLGDYTGTDVRWSDAAVDGVGAKFVLAKAVTSTAIDVTGPYMFDTEQPFSISGQNLTLNQNVKKGSCIGTIKVLYNASLVEPGYLLFNYGRASQVGPVRCFGYTDDQTLMIDSGFKFPNDLIGFSADYEGDAINVLYQRAALVPEKNVGAFWLTASNAGRIAAIEFLNEASAAGIELNIATRYPGDRGLGGEGYPWLDNYKLSDIVECFGGDDLDVELEELKNAS
jgi:hypothetical protein